MWKWFKSLFARRKYSVASLVEKCEGSLVKLQFLISDAVKYRKDEKPSDSFKKAEKTLEDGYGDCEDFAILWMKCLDELGIKSRMYNCINKTEAHAINLFEYNGKWCYTSNEHFVSTNVKAKQEALEYAYPADKYEVIV